MSIAGRRGNGNVDLGENDYANCTVGDKKYILYVFHFFKISYFEELDGLRVQST